MKKWISLLLACACMLALLAACGGADDTSGAQAVERGDTSSAGAEPNQSGEDGGAGAADGSYSVEQMYRFAIETLDLLWAGDEAVLDRLADAQTTTLSGESLEQYYDLFDGSREMIETLFSNEELLAVWRFVCEDNAVVLTKGDIPGQANELTMTGLERINHYMWFDISDIERWLVYEGTVYRGLDPQEILMENAEVVEGFDPSIRQLDEGQVTVVVDQNGELRVVLDEKALDSLCAIPNMRHIIQDPTINHMALTSELRETGYTIIETSQANLPYRVQLEEIVATINDGRVVEGLRAYAALLEEYDVEPSISMKLDALDAYDGLSADRQALVDEILAATTRAELYAMGDGMDRDTHRLFVTLQTFDRNVSLVDDYQKGMGDDVIHAQALAELTALHGLNIAEMRISAVYPFGSYDGPLNYGFQLVFTALEDLVK